MYPALEKRIPIRVANTLDLTHPGTLISPASSTLLPRVCEVTQLAVEAYEAANKTKMLFEPIAGVQAYAVVALIGFQVGNISKIKTRVEAALKAAGIFHFSFPQPVNGGRTNFSVVVDTKEAKTAARALHQAFVTKADNKRWLIPSRVPALISTSSAVGASWA